MDRELETLRRDVRNLKRALLGCGLAIVALGCAHVIANRTPSELTIGQVTIEETGITIRDPETSSRLLLHSYDVWLDRADAGSVLLRPGEFRMEDQQRRNYIRAQTWTGSGSGDGAAYFEVKTKTSPGYENALSGFHFQSRGDMAYGMIFSPHGQQFDFRSEPTR